MKTLTTLTFILFSGFSLAVETCDYDTDSQKFNDELAEVDEINEEEAWMINLSKQLLLHEDINIKTMALSHLDLYFLVAKIYHQVYRF